MNKNETLALWLSIGAAIFAVVLLYSYTQQKSAEIAKTFGEQTRVVVATKDINEMETIQENMVEIRQVPKNFVQPAHIKQVEEIVGLVALAPISKSEQILTTKIIEPGPETGLSLQVSPGKRAVTIPVDSVRGVAKLIKPGDRVDILAALDLSTGSSQKRYIKTILQDTVIVATGAQITNELPRIHQEIGGKDYIRNLRTENDFSTITIEVPPAEAQKIIYIVSTNPSSIFVTLRHPSDNSYLALKPADLSDVLGAGVIRRAASTKAPKLGK